MSETTETKQKSGKGKFGLIFIIVIAILGGSITAFMLIQSSDKQTYFTAEKETHAFMMEEVEKRFTDEIAWVELSEEQPVESTVVLSAEYNDPYAFGTESEVEEVVNNSTITIKSQSDIKNEAVFADFTADIAGLTFEDIRFSLADDAVLLELPFLKDVLQLESKDISKLLHEIDPYTFDGDEEFDFSQVFNQKDYPIPEADREYLADQYGSFVYKSLPDSAFSSEKEEVKVDGETFKAEKVKLHLTEKEAIEFFTSLLEEMQDDKRLEEIMETYLENSFMSAYEREMIMDDYHEAFDDMLEEINDIELPDGITSTIWVKSDLIVKRDIQFTAVNKVGNIGEISITGTQKLDEKDQTFDYDINVKDDYTDETVNLTADLTWDGDKIDDTITLDLNDFVIEYIGAETYKDSKRNFERSLSLQSPYMSGSIVWDGDSEYEKDQMSSNHNLYVEAEGMGEDLLSVQLDVDGKKIKEIETIDTKNVKDIGKMSESELDAYIEGEAAEQFYKWYMDKFGDLGF